MSSTRKVFLGILPISWILVICQTTLPVLGDDPCFDHGPDNVTGNYAICIDRESCPSEPIAVDACPSYPTNYACCYHRNFPGREHRGTWIATVNNMDWPRSASSNVSTQQNELRELLDKIAQAGLNAVYFQVRPAGDALYISDLEPWSIYLTGDPQGTQPSPVWDPLQFVIDYCKPLNIEVHAWINPYRARFGTPSSAGLHPNHMAVQFPRCAYPYDIYLWMDPGCGEVEDRTVNVARDLVTRYDLDGLHMDDYFYPYPVSGIPFPDDITYNEYLSSGGGLPKPDWRRENVNRLVQRLNVELHEIKPWIRFSVSPFGLFRAGHPDGMPSPPIVQGLDQYAEIYCDAKLWLKEGWVDIMQPQLYWRIAPAIQSYPILLDWWVGAGQNPKGRHVYAGNYLSRVDLQNWPIDEIRNQVEISREPVNRLRGSWGNVHFSSAMFRDDFGGYLISYFANMIYPEPALQPAYPWLANATYARVETMQPLITIDDKVNILVENGSSMKGIVHKIVIYKESQVGWNIVKILDAGYFDGSIKLLGLEKGHFSAHFINRFGQESRKTFFKIL